MVVLGSWAAANIAVGAIGLATSSGQEKYFHQMNLIWGSVNLLIAGAGYLQLRKKKSALSLSESIQAQAAIEKTFLINGGLDLVYLTAGLYCIEKSKNRPDPAQYKGYGKSLFLQGGFLLLFDAVMYSIHGRQGKQLYKLLDKLQVTGNSVGLAWKF